MEDFNKEVIKEGAEKVKEGVEKVKERKENFEEFKRRIDFFFRTTLEQYGFNLNSFPKKINPEEIRIYKSRRDEEVNKEGGPQEQRILLRLELAYLYIIISRENDKYTEIAWEELDDAYIMAKNRNLIELAEKIDTLMGDLENKDD